MDASKIQQVILNLLLNANDAVPPGGNIRLLTFRSDLNRDGLPSPHVCCEVRDNGTGIAEKDLAHIFEPFFTTKAPGAGTGLGLSTSRGILSQHGGTLEAENRRGGGASFTFCLPQAPLNSSPAPRGTTAHPNTHRARPFPSQWPHFIGR
ncbi:MAG: hypothetical protein HC904_14915 [Blastochloris sp.]|nr:hypothetical protein [Blastochloris sp.]